MFSVRTVLSKNFLTEIKTIFPWFSVNAAKLQAPQNNSGNTEFLTVAADLIHY